MPAIVQRALQKGLKPSIGRTTRFTALWSCSTILFRYFDCRVTEAKEGPLPLGARAVRNPPREWGSRTADSPPLLQVTLAQ